VVFILFGIVSLPSVEVHFAEKSVSFFISAVDFEVGVDAAVRRWSIVHVLVAAAAIGPGGNRSDKR
jgi:hypothetical protein